MKNDKLANKIIRIIELKESNQKELILSLLYSELEDLKIIPEDVVHFCDCGFPLSFKKNDQYEIIGEIIKQEVDFRNFKELFYCPNCNHFLYEI